MGDGPDPTAARRTSGAPDLASLSLLHPLPGAGLAVLRRRAARRVEVIGAGRVGAQLAALLAAAGVGVVTAVDPEPVSAADIAPGGVVSGRRSTAPARSPPRQQPPAPARRGGPAARAGARVART